MKNNEDNLARDACNDTLEFIQKMSYQYDPLMTAAYMVIQGFGLYKTLLSSEEYELMCEKMYNERHRIKEL